MLKPVATIPPVPCGRLPSLTGQPSPDRLNNMRFHSLGASDTLQLRNLNEDQQASGGKKEQAQEKRPIGCQS